MRLIRVVAIVSLFAPGMSFAASREQQEMQRDIAQLQDQVRTLQSSFDQKLATLETLVQQALDAASKANTNVSVLNAGVTSTLARELSDRLTPVAGLAAKVDNVANDSAEVRNAVSDLTVQLNHVQQQLTDISNAIKVIQAPPAPPPPAAPGDMTGAGAPASSMPGMGMPPVAAQPLYTSAMNDYQTGKTDLSLSEFNDFIKFYPNDPNAATAQFFIGQIHFGLQKYDLAVQDFDAVLERYPDSKITPDAYFLKGMALKSSGHRDEGVKEFRALIRKYPGTDWAKKASEQLRALGLSPGSPSVVAKKKRPIE